MRRRQRPVHQRVVSINVSYVGIRRACEPLLDNCDHAAKSAHSSAQSAIPASHPGWNNPSHSVSEKTPEESDDEIIIGCFKPVLLIRVRFNSVIYAPFLSRR